MPVFNWFKIYKTNNYTFLRIKPKKSFEYDENLLVIWNKLHDEYLQTFGYGEEFQKLIGLKKQYIIKLCDFIIKDDTFLLTEAEFIGSDIRAMMNKNEPISDEETLITIERSLGFRINPKEFTVKEYYTYLNYLMKNNGTKENK